MATNYKLHDFAKLLGKDVFVDANVLIYLFWPTGQHQYESNYAKVINDLIKQKNCLFVDFLVISEVVNRVLRFEYQKLNSDQSFKDFRNYDNPQYIPLKICINANFEHI